MYSLPLQTQVINQTTSEGTCRHCRTLANKRPAKTIRAVKKLKRKQLFTCSEQSSVQLGVIIKRFHAVKDGNKSSDILRLIFNVCVAARELKE